MPKPLSLAERVPPQNIEAEQSLLGSLLIDRDALIKIADIVTVEDFYKDSHRMIFEAMLDLFKNREPIDLLSLGNRLEEKRQLETVGGRTYPNCGPCSTLRYHCTKKSDLAALACGGSGNYGSRI